MKSTRKASHLTLVNFNLQFPKIVGGGVLLMSWKQIFHEMLELQRERHRVAAQLSKARRKSASSLLARDVVGLRKAVRDIVQLAGKGEATASVLAKALSNIPVTDRKMAESAVDVVLEKEGVLESISKRFAAKEANIKRKIAQLVLKDVFGGTSTADDVAVAKERLQKALREAKTFDEVIDACRSYILVKANHLLQKNGERLPHDSDVLGATKETVRGVWRGAYRRELQDTIHSLLKKGKGGEVAKRLFELWLEEKVGSPRASKAVDKLFPVLAATRDWELVTGLLRKGV
jgi:phosphopantetheinyl transferase (holo-ACP synthase)